MNINFTLKNHLCNGCGICEGVCPTKSITVVVKEGQFVPILDEATCINNKGCDRCYSACPCVGIQINEISEKCFDAPEILFDPKVGRYLNCYSGFSNDYDIRYHCASGGVLSQFLIFLLEKKYIDGAIVASFDASKELLVSSCIARTKDEVLRGKGSKYAPVTFSNTIRDIKNDKGKKFIIVGLPCHIHGFRKYEKIDKGFKKKIVGYFGLYCSGGRSFYLTEYVFKKLGIDKKSLSYFAYRDEGCLGSLVAKGISSTTQKSFVLKERYQQYYHPLRSFFVPRRCLFCPDHFAELADVSFGDIHVEPYLHDKIGINSLVVRNQQFLAWLYEAVADGCMKIEPLDTDTLLKSQKVIYQKKRRVATFMKLDEWRGRKVPQYDIELKDTVFFKSFISYIHTLLQIFIGKHKALWFIIALLKKNTKELD